jgi:hypothetical protein
MSLATWFQSIGIKVFPVSGKVPAVPRSTSWQDWRGDVTHLRSYGVALTDWLGVLDTDNPEAERWVQQQIASGLIPKTPFVVTTARGLHRYYRISGATPKFIHRDGHTLEFRSFGQYVVGPGSRHPSGVIYTAAAWSWRCDDIPFFPAHFLFDDRAPDVGEPFSDGYRFPDQAHAGERHDALFRLLRCCKGLQFTEQQTWEMVVGMNETRCKPPLDTTSRDFEAWFKRGWNLRDRPLPGRGPFHGDLTDVFAGRPALSRDAFRTSLGNVFAADVRELRDVEEF